MNILFVLNYFGLHGSSLDLLTYATNLRDKCHKLYFVGGDGFLKEKFLHISDDTFVLKDTTYLPSFKKILLLNRLVKYWNIDVIVGVGKFKALEAQLASFLTLRRSTISIMNINRPFHWQAHKKWHISKVGYIITASEYHRNMFNHNHNWPLEKIRVLSARYNIPEKIRNNKNTDLKRSVLFVRRLDSPKYNAVIRALEQFDEWRIWKKWNIKIVGGGTHEREVLKKIDNIQSRHPEARIEFLGKRKDVLSLMCQADIVVGSERVVVEAISQGCLVLLATDRGLIDLITPENIGTYCYDNFCGLNYPPVNSEKLREKFFATLSNMEEEKRIIDGNFSYVKTHLDAEYGTKILSDLVGKVHNMPLAYGDLTIGLFRIMKSWAWIYWCLLKDKLLGAS